MAIMATDSGGGGDFKKVPSGNHVAVCNMVIDLGKQRVEYMGENKVKHQIFVRWELPQERLEWTNRDGVTSEGPMVIGKTYTLSLHENAALRADLEQWRGRAFTDDERKGFDVSKLLGVPAMVSVIHADKNGKIYANVAGVAALPKGMPKPEAECPLVLYDDENRDVYDDLPEWLQKKIDLQVVEQQAQPANVGWDDDLDDSIPF